MVRSTRLYSCAVVCVLLATLVPVFAARASSQTATSRPELVLQSGHGPGTLWHVVLSADGMLLASGGRGDNTVRLWETSSGRLLRLFDAPARGQKLNSGVSALAFGGGGRLLGAGFTDGTLVAWDVATGRQLGPFGAQGATAAPFPVGVATLWFDARADRIFGADPTGIHVFNVTSGREESRIAGATPPQFWMPKAMTSDSRTIVSVDPAAKPDGEAIVLQDASSGKASKKKVPGSPAIGAAAAATPDGRVLIASVENGSLQVSDVIKGGSSRPLTLPPGVVVNQMLVSLSADGRVAVASGSTVTVWDSTAPAPTFSTSVKVPPAFPDAGAITALDFSGDGRRLAVATLLGSTAVFDTASGREASRASGAVNLPLSVAFSADGRQLLAGEKTRWNFESGRGEKLVPATGANLSAISANGRVVAVAAPASRDVQIWDAGSRRMITAVASSPGTEVGRIALSRDGTLVAVSDLAKRDMRAPAGNIPVPGALFANASVLIRIWDTGTGKEVRAISARAFGGADVMQFSPDGRQLAATFVGTATPLVFDVASGRQVASLAPAAAAPQIDLSQIPGMKKGAKVNPDTLKRVQELLEATAPMRTNISREVGDVSYAPDGRSMAVAVHDLGIGVSPVNAKPAAPRGSVEIWDITSGKQVATLAGPEAGAAHVLYGPDARSLVTVGYDNVIALSEAGSGKQIRTIGRTAANVVSLALNPDGRLLATAHDDGATRLWDVTRGEQVATLLSLNDGADWLAVTPDGLFDGSPAAWSSIFWRFTGNTFDVAPVEIFFNEYYYPDLLSDVLAGKRPRAVADIATKDRRQAQIALELAGPPSGAAAASRDVSIKIRISDAPAGARDLRLFRNGSLVNIWHGDTLQGKASAEFDATVPLVAGVNRFSAYVFNRDNIKSRDAVAEVTGAESLRRKGVAHVVAVGINEYENPDYNLRYAVADAKAFGADVKAQLEKLNRFERVDVAIVADREATKANIMKSLEALAARVQPEDEVLVFVASHGAAAGDRFYLIPTDLGYQGKRAELDEKAVETILAHSISDQEMEAAFERVNVSRLLFVIDACNSGQALEAEEKRRGPMNSRGLAQLAYEKGMYVLTASQSYQAAQEVSELGHGLLTYALVTEGLDTGAADGEPQDGRVIAREWLDYATGRVPRLQVEKMAEARKAGRQLRFSAPRGGAVTDDATQHPRVFYRRELDDAVWIVSSRQR